MNPISHEKPKQGIMNQNTSKIKEGIINQMGPIKPNEVKKEGIMNRVKTKCTQMRHYKPKQEKSNQINHEECPWSMGEQESNNFDQ